MEDGLKRKLSTVLYIDKYEYMGWNKCSFTGRSGYYEL